MVTLPRFPRELHPNSRPHWAKKAKAAKACRERAAWETKAAKPEVPQEGPISVCLVFCPPDNRRRDIDGAFSSCKAYLDGVADGLGVNDYRFKFAIEWGTVVSGGQVRVFLEGK